jgi:hypothetical protein
MAKPAGDLEPRWQDFDEWAQEHSAVRRAFHKLPRKQLEFVADIANWQADRATDLFKKALAQGQTFRRLAEQCASLLPESEQRGELAERLKAEAKNQDALKALARRGGQARAAQRRVSTDTRIRLAEQELGARAERITNKTIAKRVSLHPDSVRRARKRMRAG